MRMEKEKPIWMKRTSEELESLVVKMANQGMGAEKIGLVLRDTYGIPSTRIFAKKMSEILKEKGIVQEPQDIANLLKKSEKLKKHLAKNKKDRVSKRSLQIIGARINKLKKYYKKQQKI